MSKNRSYFESLDHADPLAHLRSSFEIPSDIIYLDGNSLGAKPAVARKLIGKIVNNEWGDGLVRSWNDAGWFDLPLTLGKKVAKIIGARGHEVVVTDSTSINLFKALSCALQINSDRSVIIIESNNFPTNNYVLQGLVKSLAGDFVIKEVPSQELSSVLDDTVALVCLTQVHYRTGELLDIKKTTQQIHAVGALAIWDLSHSAGVIDLEVSACDVDFAVGCTYKYLNGGPGSPAYIYMSEKHHNKCLQPLWAWWGHEAPFAFEQTYQPSEGISQMLTGTQPIVSLALTEIGLDIAMSADIKLVREKSSQLTQHFIDLIRPMCAEFDLTILSPLSPQKRGSQVALKHLHGHSVMAALIDSGVIGDFRAPDVLRFGFSPLYIRYVDLWDAVDTLKSVLQTSKWQAPKYQQKSKVT